MIRHRALLPLALLALALVVAPEARSGVERAPLAAPLGTAFTYQGLLKQSGAPANGTFNMDFRLFDVPTGSVPLATQSIPSVSVVNGLFTQTLDFGAGMFTGDARWLEIAVNTQTLLPRQPVTPAPYALALPALYTQSNATSPNLIRG